MVFFCSRRSGGEEESKERGEGQADGPTANEWQRVNLFPFHDDVFSRLLRLVNALKWIQALEQEIAEETE
jgi:hypothetical protein